MLKLQAIGHLGKDATNNVVSGKQVINFSIAHSESFKNAQGEKVTKTVWVECAWWNESKAIQQYLTKGAQVFVEGQPEVRTYPKNDGSQGVSLSLRVGMLQLLGSANGGGQTQEATTEKTNIPAAAKAGTKAAVDVTELIDDLPF